METHTKFLLLHDELLAIKVRSPHQSLPACSLDFRVSAQEAIRNFSAAPK